MRRRVRFTSKRAYVFLRRDLKHAHATVRTGPTPAKRPGPLSAAALTVALVRASLRDPATRALAFRVHFRRLAALAALIILGALCTYPNEQKKYRAEHAPDVTQASSAAPADTYRFQFGPVSAAYSPDPKSAVQEQAAHAGQAGRDVGRAYSHKDEHVAPALIPKSSWFARHWEWLSGLYAFTVVAEWILIALTRQYDDQLARRVSLLAGVIPEDPEKAPAIKFDLKWLWRKVKQRFRGMFVYFSGFPVFVLLVANPIGWRFATVLTLAWSAYWALVFTAAKSAHAWHDEGAARPAWFVRLAERLFSRFRATAWFPRLWQRVVGRIGSPCQAAETHWPALAGIVAIRSLTHVPGVYLMLRPFIPVVVARVLASSDVRARLMIVMPAATRCAESGASALSPKLTAVHIEAAVPTDATPQAQIPR